MSKEYNSDERYIGLISRPASLRVICMTISATHPSKHTGLASNFWFYSVAVITSGSDRHYSCNVGHPGDPGSIPGKTYPFALSDQ
jgi:hypothetical protein